MGEPASPEQLKAAPTDDQNTVKQQHVPTPATEQNEAVNEAEKTHDEAEKVGDETESKDSKPVENIEEQAVNGGKESGGEKVHGDTTQKNDNNSKNEESDLPNATNNESNAPNDAPGKKEAEPKTNVAKTSSEELLRTKISSSNICPPLTRLKSLDSMESNSKEEKQQKVLKDIVEVLVDIARNKLNKSSKSKKMGNIRHSTNTVLTKDNLAMLCSEAKKSFLSAPMLLKVKAPITVVGDIHGQFLDLVYILTSQGMPPDQKYLFLGDYVDRGQHSIETISLLFALKLLYPDHFYLLRGNHEDQNINKQYGFYDECKKWFSIKVWRQFCDTFKCMPIAACIEDKIFCAHGGISKDLKDMNEINCIERPCNVPDEGLLCDILWSDPEPAVNGYAPNDRGVSYVFGYDKIHEFNERFNFDLIVRAHQLEQDGYAFHCNRQLLTIFSARNYCGEYFNQGAVLVINENLLCTIHFIQPTNMLQKNNVRSKG